MRRLGWLCLFLGLCCAGLAASAAAAERTWTDTKGRTMRAEFVREVDGDVTFLKDGKLITIALTTLAERDRQIIRDLAAGRPVPEEPRTTSPAEASPLETTPANPAASPPGVPKGDEPKPAAGASSKPLPIVNRVWTDRFGNQTTAKFVRIFGNQVVLSRANKTITLPFYDLTSEDQDHLRELLTSRGQKAQIPPPPPKPVDPPEDPAPGNPAPAAPSFPSSPPNFPSFPTPPNFGGGGGFEAMQQRMEENRQRAEQRRQEMMQQAEQRRQESEQRDAEARQKYQEDMERRRQEAEEARQNETVGECLSCKGRLTRDQTELDACPHCGVAWQFEVDSFGRKKRIYNASPVGSTGSGATPAKLDPATMAKAKQFLVIGVVVVGVLGMFAVVVFVAITIAAASGAKRQRRYS